MVKRAVLKVVITVEIEGVPATGIIDTGSGITMVSGNLFKTIITTAGLKEEDFKPANKQAFNYDK